jgi:hypothetical protein
MPSVSTNGDNSPQYKHTQSVGQDSLCCSGEAAATLMAPSPAQVLLKCTEDGQLPGWPVVTPWVDMNEVFSVTDS